MKVSSFLSIAAAIVTLSGTVSHAATLASYSNLDNPNNNPLQPNNWGDFVEKPSVLTGAAGSGITKVDNQYYTGWSTSIDTSKYVGFTIVPTNGYQITVTDMSFRTRPADTNAQTSFVWGYRINEGAGFGQWNFGSIWNNDSANYTSSLAKTWDIPDFTTTGTVEFGVFATTANASSMEIRTAQVNGTMAPAAAVPEPSTWALLGLSATIAVIGFRRRGTACR
jgi:hypothetical protein